MISENIQWLRPFRQSDYQFFREWAIEAWEECGGRVVSNLSIPWILRMLFGKLGFARSLFRFGRSKLLVCCTGRPDYYVWPHCLFHEIIPVLWDCWPKYWPALVRFCRRCRVKTIFCTSSQVAEMLTKSVPGINAVWLPEGIKTDLYPMGPKLVDRKNDIMKFGRDVGGKLLYPTQESFSQGLRDSKIVICRPRCDTNPEHAQGLETLTQRYWECMLSGALIVGRAPQELIRFCGYNPVIEAPAGSSFVVSAVLANLADYQSLADRNRAFAESHADWRERMKVIENNV